MQLIGLDVGFSAKRRSTGVAVICNEDLRVGRARTDVASRFELLDGVRAADVAAIDAPLLAVGSREPRPCESLFSRGLFQRRCKPGQSHIKGTGLRLRDAGNEAAAQFAALTSGAELAARIPRILPGRNIIEAFPNAFLGVCVASEKFEAMPSMRRGGKFDWLYDVWRETGKFGAMIGKLGGVLPRSIEQRCMVTRNHDERAALVCLLTAASVAVGKYTAIGEPTGGYFFLPQWSSWTTWARGEVNVQRARGMPVDVWIDGEVSQRIS